MIIKAPFNKSTHHHRSQAEQDVIHPRAHSIPLSHYTAGDCEHIMGNITPIYRPRVTATQEGMTDGAR